MRSCKWVWVLHCRHGLMFRPWQVYCHLHMQPQLQGEDHMGPAALLQKAEQERLCS